MKDNKTVKLEIRLTPKEKEQIKEFAGTHNLSISELVRMGLAYVMNKEEK